CISAQAQDRFLSIGLSDQNPTRARVPRVHTPLEGPLFDDRAYLIQMFQLPPLFMRLDCANWEERLNMLPLHSESQGKNERACILAFMNNLDRRSEAKGRIASRGPAVFGLQES